MTDSRFRQLLFLYVISSVAAIAALFLPGGYSQELSEAYYSEPEPWLAGNDWVFLGIAIPLLSASIAGFVGLFLFKAWGRTVSLYTTVASLALLLLGGPTLLSALESLLWEVATLTWGAIMALAYFSPIASRFGR